MAKRLWDKGDSIDQLIQTFTVGNDPLLDRKLIRWDCFGSAAHARMLVQIGILEKTDLPGILEGLSDIREQALEGSFDIPVELEDGHTAIESALVDKLGETGKRIHAGRSRNDQVITAMRLYQRDALQELILGTLSWCEAMLERIEELGDVDMPGYTHLQRAMPSSIGMWLQAFVESGLSTARFGQAVLDSLDSNPLGAAAGFGASLPLDRDATAKYLGFSRVQRSPIDVQNSRGRFELRLARWCTEVHGLIEKLAWDMHLYFSEEFGFFSLPVEFTTGSSIMPQKRNPDVLELLRARASKARGIADELEWVCGKLPSNYHRDYQYSKEPVLRLVDATAESLEVVRHVCDSFSVNKEALDAAMTPELYATYHAYRLVQDGKPFRDAYRETAALVTSGGIDVASLKAEGDSIKSAAREHASEAKGEIASLRASVERSQQALRALEDAAFQVGSK